MTSEHRDLIKVTCVSTLLIVLIGFGLHAAFGQANLFPQTLPANTILGRLGIGPGPVQAIPTTTILNNLSLPTIVITGDPTGVVDSGAACNAAVSALNPTVGGHIQFATKGTYLFTQTCSLNGFIEPATVDIDLMGSTITASGVTAFSRLPSTQTQALSWVGARMYIHGGYLTGNGTAGTYGILLGACYACRVYDIEVGNFDTGIDGIFCLDCHIHDARGIGNLTSFITLESGSGRWTGGATNNSASNNSTINNVRDYASSGQTYQIHIIASDGIHVIDSIMEGFNPTYGLYYDDQSSTTVKQIIINNVHVENCAATAKFSFNGVGGSQIVIDGVMDQSGCTSSPEVDASGITNQAMLWVNRVFVTYNNMFKVGFNQAWNLEGLSNGAIDPSASSLWVGGTLPTQFIGFGRQTAGNGWEIFVHPSGQTWIGSPSEVTTSESGVFWQTNQFFPTDDTWGIGTTSNLTSQRFRPHAVVTGPTGGFYVSGSTGKYYFGCPTDCATNLNYVATNVIGSTWVQNQSGDNRLDANFTMTSTVAFATVNGSSKNLTATLAAGRTYSFEAAIYVTAGASAGGIKLQLAGTSGLTATNIVYDGYSLDTGATPIRGYAQASALGTTVASAISTSATVTAYIHGTITVNAAGVLAVQAAQNSSNGTSTVIGQGSTFIVRDVP